jgi:hypothetical protein
MGRVGISQHGAAAPAIPCCYGRAALQTGSITNSCRAQWVGWRLVLFQLWTLPMTENIFYLGLALVAIIAFWTLSWLVGLPMIPAVAFVPSS